MYTIFTNIFLLFLFAFSLSNCNNLEKELVSVKEINTVLMTMIIDDHLDNTTNSETCSTCDSSAAACKNTETDECGTTKSNEVLFKVDLDYEESECTCNASKKLEIKKLEIYLYDHKHEYLGQITFPSNHIGDGFYYRKLLLNDCQAQNVKYGTFRLYHKTSAGERVEETTYKSIQPKTGYVAKFDLQVNAYTGSIVVPE